MWEFVRSWIGAHYPMPVFVGDNPGRFSPSAARNDAARQAGDWDVAVFHDSDTIAHPDAIHQAIQMASESMAMVVTADSHMYCDRPSSQRIMDSQVTAFARPQSFDSNGIYEKPCSGIIAVNRTLFNTVGGYVESLSGWGYEDLVFLQMCGIFGNGNTWVPDHINLHLWHEPSPRDEHTRSNKAVWEKLTEFRRRRDQAGARTYLASLGHHL